MKKQPKPNPSLPTHASPPTSPVLAMKLTTLPEIRDNALRARFEISKTIAELDAWRTEIDATIAFLKSQRKK